MTTREHEVLVEKFTAADLKAKDAERDYYGPQSTGISKGTVAAYKANATRLLMRLVRADL